MIVDEKSSFYARQREKRLIKIFPIFLLVCLVYHIVCLWGYIWVQGVKGVPSPPSYTELQKKHPLCKMLEQAELLIF